MQDDETKLTLDVDASHRVSALVRVPRDSFACLTLAHGAGAGMAHPFLAAVADGLAARGMATLRFQFPSREAGSFRPDSPALAQATVRAAAVAAAGQILGLPLFAGGKSFGGRMTSGAQAASPLPGVRGLVFFGFPLHAAGKPATSRADHLAAVHLPMLFLQGTRDALADLGLLAPVTAAFESRATLHVVDGADHSFHVPKRSGRNDAEVVDEMLDVAVAWMAGVLA